MFNLYHMLENSLYPSRLAQLSYYLRSLTCIYFYSFPKQLLLVNSLFPYYNTW